MGIFFDDLSEKRSCTTCKHYSTFMGCAKSVPLPKQNASTCSYFENVYKYKEQLKKEKAAKEERDRLERERNEVELENERLRRENERLSSSASSSLYSSPDSLSTEFSDYSLDDDSYIPDDEPEEMTQEELEETLLEKFELLSKEIAKNFTPVIKQIKDLRKEDYSNNVVTIDGLDDFMESVKTLKDSLENSEGSKSYKRKIEKLKTEYEYKLDSFLSLFKEEINWNFDNQRFNVAFALSESFAIAEHADSANLYKKCKAKYVEYFIQKASDLIKQQKYEDAIEYLVPVSKEKGVKDLLDECYKGLDGILINKAKAFMSEEKYADALELLNNVGHSDVVSLIEECQTHIDEKKIIEAKECISLKKYDEAVEILKTVRTSESAALMKKAREEKKIYLVNKIENLKKERKYDDAIAALRQLGGNDMNDSISSCRIDKAIWLYNSGHVDDSIRELQDIKTEESNTLIRRIKSNNKKRKTRIAGIIVLSFGILFLIIAIVSAARISASMDPNISYSEASRIIDQCTPWEVIGFLFGIPSFIAGLVLTLISLKKYPIKRIK